MTIARRSLLQSLAASAALPALIDAADAQEKAAPPRGKRRTLIKGGHVATMDKTLGELPVGDVLIEDGVIAAIAPSIKASDAEVVDARDKLVMPGLIDTHRHTWETLTRSWIGRRRSAAVYMEILTGTLGYKIGPRTSISATCSAPSGRSIRASPPAARLVAHHEHPGACRRGGEGPRRQRHPLIFAPAGLRRFPVGTRCRADSRRMPPM